MATPVKADLSELRPYQKLQNELAQRVTLDSAGGSGFDIAASVIDGIMTAETIEDVFALNSSGPTDIEDYLNVPLNFTQVTFFKSNERYGGLGFYVVIDAYTDTAEEIKISTGAPNVVASMRKFETLGVFNPGPFRAKIASRDTANGSLYYMAPVA